MEMPSSHSHSRSWPSGLCHTPRQLKLKRNYMVPLIIWNIVLSACSLGFICTLGYEAHRTMEKIHPQLDAVENVLPKLKKVMSEIEEIKEVVAKIEELPDFDELNELLGDVRDVLQVPPQIKK